MQVLYRLTLSRLRSLLCWRSTIWLAVQTRPWLGSGWVGKTSAHGLRTSVLLSVCCVHCRANWNEGLLIICKWTLCTQTRIPSSRQLSTQAMRLRRKRLSNSLTRRSSSMRWRTWSTRWSAGWCSSCWWRRRWVLCSMGASTRTCRMTATGTARTLRRPSLALAADQNYYHDLRVTINLDWLVCFMAMYLYGDCDFCASV